MVNALDSKASSCKKTFIHQLFTWIELTRLTLLRILDFSLFLTQNMTQTLLTLALKNIDLNYLRLRIVVSKFLFASDLTFTGRPNKTSLTNWIHGRAKCLWKSTKCKYESRKIWVSTTLKVLFWVCYDFFDLLVIAL